MISHKKIVQMNTFVDKNNATADISNNIDLVDFTTL